MRTLFALLCVLAIPAAANEIPVTIMGAKAIIPLSLNVGLGSSIPENEISPIYKDNLGPSRATGGETVVISFREAKVISSLTLTAYSNSGRGKILMRKATARTGLKGANGVLDLTDLYVFDENKGIGENHNGLLMLFNEDLVSTTPDHAVKSIALVMEGYTHNDSSLLIQLESEEGFVYDDFSVRRTGRRSGEEIGGYFDESDYHSFSIGDLRRLMRNGSTPTIEELAGTSWSCSVYSPQAAPELDFKTRQYFSVTEGLLQSTTDLEGRPLNWILTQLGWRAPTYPFTTNCGEIRTAMNMRVTSGGNITVEQVFNANELRNACLNRGFSRASIEDYLRRYSYPSEFGRASRVSNSEFCRPVGN